MTPIALRLSRSFEWNKGMTPIADAFTERAKQGDIGALQSKLATGGDILCEPIAAERLDVGRTGSRIRRSVLSPRRIGRQSKNRHWGEKREQRIRQIQTEAWRHIAIEAGLTDLECRRYLAYDGTRGSIMKMAESEGVYHRAICRSIESAKRKLKRCEL